MVSVRIGGGLLKVRAWVRNSYFSMLQTALRPVHRRMRPKTMSRIGQVSSSSTGQLMDSSTNAPGMSGRSVLKATPPLPILMVWPEPVRHHYPILRHL